MAHLVGQASLSDAELGRAAALAILASGTEQADFEERLTAEFARAAVDAIGEHFSSQGLMRQILRGATHGASQLNVEEFHGLIEIIQNADDVGAEEVRIGVRRKAHGAELLVAHDGGRVLLRHVVAMSFAFLTTKAEESESKGRFGIGLKTLARLGSNLEVHCPPYHFVVRAHGPRSVGPAAMIPGFFSPGSGQTLLRLSLRRDFDVQAFKAWFKDLDASHLLFLDTVASIRFVEFSSGARTLLTHELSRGKPRQVVLAGSRGPLNAGVVTLQDRRSRGTWTRVTVDFPVPRTLARTGKATGRTSSISIAVGGRESAGRLFAGLPLRVETHLPFNLNAQFDPDTAREKVQHIRWNEWLIERAADLISATARWRFDTSPENAWRWVPLTTEAACGSDPWLEAQLERMVASTHADLSRRLRLRVGDQVVPVSKLAYEDSVIEGLLTVEDQREMCPGDTPVPGELRGSRGRWRRVLDDLATSDVITVGDAVSMFGWDEARLGSRGGDWYVGLAAAALGANLDDRLDQLSSVRCASGERTRPPSPTDSFCLVSTTYATGFAADLGLVKIIDDAYFAGSPASIEVRRWLERKNRLREGIGTLEALEQLAKRGSPPQRLTDEQLVAIRDAMSALEPGVRRRLGPQLGEKILVQGFEWSGSRRSSIAVRPADAYLSATIDATGRESWARAADRTPGIKWIHARYRVILKDPEPAPAGATDERLLGARALFTMLGAESAPRLVEPRVSETRYGDVAFPIRPSSGEAQAEAIRALREYASHLKGDSDSPDLEAVVRDLVKQRPRVRRPRSRALLRTLARAWNRLYAEHVVATAVQSVWSWQQVGKVPASWLSILISEPWLSNRLGRSKAPRLLAFQSPRMLDAFGPNNALYGAEFDGMEAHANVLEALGVQTFPHASRIIAALGELRQKGDSGDSVARDAAVLYDALGQHTAAVTGAVTPDQRVDDLTIGQIRARFGIAAGKPGLILASGRWLPPNGVFRGPAIFGKRRPFVPGRTRPDRLWEVLNIQPRLSLTAWQCCRRFPTPTLMRKTKPQ